MEGDSRARSSTQARRLLAYGALGLVVALFVASVVVGVAILNTPSIASSGSYSGGGPPNFVFAIPMVLLACLATLIVIRRDGNRIGWLLLGAVVAVALQGFGSDYGTYAITLRHREIPFGDIATGLGDFLWLPFVAMALVLPAQLFPDGRPLSRRWRALVIATVVVVVLGYLGNTFGPKATPGLQFPHVSSGLIGAVLGLAPALLPVFALCGLLGLVSLVLRYGRSASDVRHQIRWLMYAALLYIVPFAAYTGIQAVTGRALAILAIVSVLGLAMTPFAMAIAVLRYRLYDIDVVISRTLVYGSLAAFITAVYVAIVVGVGTLLGSGSQPNLLLSIVATAIVAVAFQPVRERLQKIANRVVYGRRATPYEVLSQFSERVAETYAADETLPRMARVLAKGTGSERAEVWLRTGDTLRAAATWPDGSGNGSQPTAAPGPAALDGDELPPLLADRAVAVRHQGELLGALAVTKRPGESLTPVEEKLLTDLAAQAGLVLKNVRLTAELLTRLEELRASRQRLVAAQDEERRRLERNLHDGAQQNLVAIKVKLGLAEALADKDPGRARDLVAQLKSDTDEALETLRDLARGIYPPLLADRGLPAALEAQARKAAVAVEVQADGVGRFPQEVEMAVYFCVLEALQNVQKYAAAERATVRLAADDGHLSFVVSDDGAGFDRTKVRLGAGLQNMTDRLEALGGSVEVTSAAGQGTTLEGRIPVALALATAT